MSLPEHHVVTLVLFMLSFQCNEIWTCQRRESFNGGLFLSGAKVHSWESRSGLKVMKSELWERKSEESNLHPNVAQMSSVGDLKPVFCLTQQSCLFLSGGITIKTKSTRPHKTRLSGPQPDKISKCFFSSVDLKPVWEQTLWFPPDIDSVGIKL